MRLKSYNHQHKNQKKIYNNNDVIFQSRTLPPSNNMQSTLLVQEKYIFTNPFEPTINNQKNKGSNGLIKAADFNSLFLTTSSVKPPKVIMKLRTKNPIRHLENIFLSSQYSSAVINPIKPVSFYGTSHLKHGDVFASIPLNQKCTKSLLNNHQLQQFSSQFKSAELNFANSNVILMYSTYMLYAGICKLCTKHPTPLNSNLKLFYALQHDSIESFPYTIPLNYISYYSELNHKSSYQFKTEKTSEDITDSSMYAETLNYYNHLCRNLNTNNRIYNLIFNERFKNFNLNRCIQIALNYIDNDDIICEYLQNFPSVTFSYTFLVQNIFSEHYYSLLYNSFTPQSNTSSVYYVSGSQTYPQYMLPRNTCDIKSIYPVINNLSLYLISYRDSSKWPSGHSCFQTLTQVFDENHLLEKIHFLYKKFSMMQLYNKNSSINLLKSFILNIMEKKIDDSVIYVPEHDKPSSSNSLKSVLSQLEVNKKDTLSNCNSICFKSYGLNMATEFICLKYKLLYRCLNKLHTTVDLLDKIPSNYNTTLFIWDWDDTLFPTFSLANQWKDGTDFVVPKHVASHISLLENKLVETLKITMRYGRVILITNASYAWFFESATKLVPFVWKFIKKNSLHILSARDICESFTTRSGDWKRELILHYIQMYYEPLYVDPVTLHTSFKLLKTLNVAGLFRRLSSSEKFLFCDETISDNVRLSRFCRILSKMKKIHLRIFVMLGLIVNETYEEVSDNCHISSLCNRRSDANCNINGFLNTLNQISSICPVCQFNNSGLCDLSGKQFIDRNFDIYCNQYLRCVDKYMQMYKATSNRSVQNDIQINIPKNPYICIPNYYTFDFNSLFQNDVNYKLQLNSRLSMINKFPEIPSEFNLSSIPCTVMSIGDGESERLSILNAISDYYKIQHQLIMELNNLKNFVKNLLYPSFLNHFSIPYEYSKKKETSLNCYIKAPVLTLKFISLKLESKPSIKGLYKTHHFLQQIFPLILRVNQNIDATILDNTVYYRKND